MFPELSGDQAVLDRLTQVAPLRYGCYPLNLNHKVSSSGSLARDKIHV
jgi:hypothetical protein